MLGERAQNVARVLLGDLLVDRDRLEHARKRELAFELEVASFRDAAAMSLEGAAHHVTLRDFRRPAMHGVEPLELEDATTASGWVLLQFCALEARVMELFRQNLRNELRDNVELILRGRAVARDRHCGQQQ